MYISSLFRLEFVVKEFLVAADFNKVEHDLDFRCVFMFLQVFSLKILRGVWLGFRSPQNLLARFVFFDCLRTRCKCPSPFSGSSAISGFGLHKSEGIRFPPPFCVF